MNHQQASRQRFEWMYWLAVVMATLVILAPMFFLLPDFPFLWSNVIFIVVFFIFLRWIFLLRYSWFARVTWVKLAIMALCIPLLFLLLDRLGGFMGFIDEYGLQTFMDHLDFDDYKGLSAYLRFEMLFFGVGSIVTTILVGFRMLISIWRVRNRGTV